MKKVRANNRKRTTIPNEVIRDETISNAAKGLYAVLISFAQEDIRFSQEFFKDSKADVYAQLSELANAGYIEL